MQFRWDLRRPNKCILIKLKLWPKYIITTERNIMTLGSCRFVVKEIVSDKIRMCHIGACRIFLRSILPYILHLPFKQFTNKTQQNRTFP